MALPECEVRAAVRTAAAQRGLGPADGEQTLQQALALREKSQQARPQAVGPPWEASQPTKINICQTLPLGSCRPSTRLSRGKIRKTATALGRCLGLGIQLDPL